MTYDWYNLFNQTEWLATGLVARTLIVNLESRGRTVFEVTQGATTAITYDDQFLPVNFLETNPYTGAESDSAYAVYLDPDDNVWFGFLVT